MMPVSTNETASEKLWPFGDLKRNHYGAIYADPPWAFNLWWGGRASQGRHPKSYPSRSTEPKYGVMDEAALSSLPLADLAAEDCVLFLWTCWPVMPWALRVIEAWGFEYKTCAFCWVKAHARQMELLQDEIEPHMTLGYWTRSNSEFCMLATRGKPKRQACDVKQAIIEPRREHSRKPDCVYGRIERLVAGPYVELFARNKRLGWDSWGNETGKFAEVKTA